MNTKIKFAKFIGACAIALFGMSTNASAQASETLDVNTTAQIVEPITIAKVRDLSFGKFSVNGNGTIVLQAIEASTRTPGGAITLPADQGTVTSAKFTIGGEDNYGFIVTLGATPVTLVHEDANGDELEVATFVVRNAAGSLAPFQLSGSGAETIYVGATLTAEAADDAGVYEAEDPFTITVNYQ